MTLTQAPPAKTTADSNIWRPDDGFDPDAFAAKKHGKSDAYDPDIQDAIEAHINASSDKLRKLSVDIHDHPELSYEETRTHDVLTAFISDEGFEVQKQYLLPTGWIATYTRGQGGRTIGVNSEMDALPGIGHACGHNLIAIAGVAVACAIKAIMEKFDISGKIVLLGTPAEEGGYGKNHMLDQGAYKDMDICLMCHPAPGPQSSVSLSSSLALIRVEVEYTGHSAHAALSPWEGQNALDAAVLAYNNIALLRQQVRPTHRVHGVFKGKDWAANIIPDNSQMLWYIRAPTMAEAKETFARVKACFEAAGIASGCQTSIKEVKPGCHDLRQNKALGDELAEIVNSRYGSIDFEWGIAGASTDFGYVTYALPGLHPGFSIPTVENGGNHTPGFTAAAKTIEAHKACLIVSKALAGVGVKALTDAGFLKRAQDAFEEDKKVRGEL